MDVAIAGGHGKIALELTRLLAERGYRTRSLIRNAGQDADVRAAGGEPVVIDLETASDEAWDDAIRGVDAVVFAAGAGPGSGAARKETVDYGAAVKLIHSCERTGVRRYLMISAVSADPAREGDEVYDVYCRAKGQADAELIASGLEFVILRPVTLTDGPATGKVSAGSRQDLASTEIPRGDVALALAELADRPDLSGHTIFIASGIVPIARAF